ncbi:MAG: bifunctional UDP-N-acetylglucosamine pyrophosphorylase/glucosamine-1-phosphate N-acetyltransferase [Planctomycetota bacterium]
MGAGTNIGAGTIVANYDGTHKHKSTIGDRAFIGSGSILIAPSQVGDDALTGAGAVLRRGTTVEPGQSWVGVPARPLPKKPG